MVLENNTSLYEKLSRSFYERSRVELIAQELLGKYLVSCVDGHLTAGRIVETEAYCGRNDKACHASKGRTKRTSVMFGQGGHAYVYICYGIHHLFNVVTNVEGEADAVLIRALEPIDGLDHMTDRRSKVPDNLTSGPGVLSQAMGIDRSMTGVDLLGDLIWIAPGQDESMEIEVDKRIGVEYAGEDADRLWRFYEKRNNYVSKIKKPGRDPGSTNLLSSELV